MRTTLTLLAVSTALTAAPGLPALSAAGTTDDLTAAPVFSLARGSAQPLPLLLASGDDDDDTVYRRSRGDDDDDDDDDDECDDDDDCGGSARNPAPAGTVAPPANGLFGNGAPPKAVTN